MNYQQDRIVCTQIQFRATMNWEGTLDAMGCWLKDNSATTRALSSDSLEEQGLAAIAVLR